MASVAAARRTQSAFPRILAASNPSDVTVDTGSQSPGLVGRLSHLPQVRSAESYVALNALRALPSGYADPDTPFNQQVELVGSLNGLYFDQDRVIITAGRRANPRRPGEVVVSELTAHRFGLHLGQSLAANFYSGQQAADPAFNPMTRPPLRRVRLTITGIGVFTDEVVQDDIDRSYRVLATPALTRTELRCCGSFYWTGLRLARGAGGRRASFGSFFSCPQPPAIRTRAPGVGGPWAPLVLLQQLLGQQWPWPRAPSAAQVRSGRQPPTPPAAAPGPPRRALRLAERLRPRLRPGSARTPGAGSHTDRHCRHRPLLRHPRGWPAWHALISHRAGVAPLLSLTTARPGWSRTSVGNLTAIGLQLGKRADSAGHLDATARPSRTYTARNQPPCKATTRARSRRQSAAGIPARARPRRRVRGHRLVLTGPGGGKVAEARRTDADAAVLRREENIGGPAGRGAGPRPRGHR